MSIESVSKERVVLGSFLITNKCQVRENLWMGMGVVGPEMEPVRIFDDRYRFHICGG